MLIYGINPVLEALRAKRVSLLRLSPRADDRLTEIVRLADEQGLAVQRMKSEDLDRLAGGGGQRHQGVVAGVDDARSYRGGDLGSGGRGGPPIGVLDSL